MRFLILISLLIAPALSFAVRTAHCPQQIEVRTGNFEITKSFEAILAELYNDADLQRENVRQSIQNLMRAGLIARVLPLTQKNNGRCVYGNPRADAENIVIYTTQGRDVFLFQTPIGPDGLLLRAYADVEVHQGKVTAGHRGAGLALAVPRYPYKSYHAGGLLVFFGRAGLQAR